VIKNSAEQGGGPPVPGRVQPDTIRDKIIKRADKKRVLFERCMVFLQVTLMDRFLAPLAILIGDLL